MSGIAFTATPLNAKSFWSTTTVPQNSGADEASAVTLGLRFSSDVAGVVTGVRFYKGFNNTGTHVGTLWNSAGAALATVTFANETYSGWQEASFASPVSISPNTQYVISYFAPVAHYALSVGYDWAGVRASPLRLSASPSVYIYGSTNAYPISTWYNSNYFVDVVFVPSATTATYSISGVVSGSTATLSLSGPKTGTVTTDSTGTFTSPAYPRAFT